MLLYGWDVYDHSVYTSYTVLGPPDIPYPTRLASTDGSVRPNGRHLTILSGRTSVAVPITPVRTGDIVKLKKAHPCGTNEWFITRVGMDIGLECSGCGRKVLLARYEFDRRFRGFLRKSAEE